MALLDHTSGSTVYPRYVEYVDGYAITRASGSSFTLTAGNQYTLQCRISDSGGDLTLDFYVGGTLRLDDADVDVTWDGGHVGPFRASGETTTELAWDDFLCGVDNSATPDWDLLDAEDYVYGDYDFDGNHSPRTLQDGNPAAMGARSESRTSQQAAARQEPRPPGW